MTRTNSSANTSYYGATTRSAPPPYPGISQPWPGSPQLVDLPKPVSERTTRILRSPWFIPFLVFIVTAGLCMHVMPVTYCNDPLDPEVRERTRDDWNRELLDHEKQVAQREVVKARWAWEDEQHAKLLRGWDEERISHEFKLKERAQREEEERVRLNLFWGHVEAHRCKGYGTREYSAVLMNLPIRWGRRVNACRATPLEIHGASYLPNTCEDRGSSMIGRWEVSQQEPDCVTSWESYHDKGCTSPGSGKKYITHKLMNIPEHGDWREFCATTPISFNDMQFPGAQECIESIWGIYGQWEIDDDSCR